MTPTCIAAASGTGIAVGIGIALLLFLSAVIVCCRKRLSPVFRILWNGLLACNPYLVEPAHISPFAVLLLLVFVYTKFKAGPPLGWIVTALPLLLLLLALKASRRIFYSVIACAMALLIGWGVFVDAQGEQDPSSDRDDAVEAAAANFLRGENPWSSQSVLGLQITTGPSSVFLALPSVALTGRVDALTFTLWLVFLGLLLYGDLKNRNNTFPTLCMFLVLPLSGFLHTIHWGLDELYYAAILSPLLWLALDRKWLVSAGVVGGFMVFSRVSYAPAVLAAGLWWLLAARRRPADVARIALGGTIYVTLAVGVLWLIGGDAFLQDNFLHNSHVTRLKQGNNLLVTSVLFVLRAFPHGQVGSTLLVLAITGVGAFCLRRTPHPFFHISGALLLAHTIAFAPKYPQDYQLAFLIPAIYGVAFSSLTTPKTECEVEEKISNAGR